jgi:hypothetical protein
MRRSPRPAASRTTIGERLVVALDVGHLAGAHGRDELGAPGGVERRDDRGRCEGILRS